MKVRVLGASRAQDILGRGEVGYRGEHRLDSCSVVPGPEIPEVTHGELGELCEIPKVVEPYVKSLVRDSSPVLAPKFNLKSIGAWRPTPESRHSLPVSAKAALNRLTSAFGAAFSNKNPTTFGFGGSCQGC